MGSTLLDRPAAESLLQDLVSIPSVSGDETTASRWLVEQMNQLGFERSFVDSVGNAIGEIGSVDAEQIILLLGHIDTVPGHIPVRIEEQRGQEGARRVLFGRGSVDAKGPLAAFVAATARLGSEWAATAGVRLIVVGAVEEEAATSRGARSVVDWFRQERINPSCCIIGEPSGWDRVTLGYKGRLLLDLNGNQPMAHTAGPDPGVAVCAIRFWNRLEKIVATYNTNTQRLFDQILPSLRELKSWTSERMDEHVSARIGLRLPPNFDCPSFTAELKTWIEEETEGQVRVDSGDRTRLEAVGEHRRVCLELYAFEPAWRSSNKGILPRAFRSAIRRVGGGPSGFLVKTGTSDMNVVGPVWQCPIVAYGPGDSRLDHTPNEHLDLEDYWRSIQILEAALDHLAGAGFP